MDCGSSHLRNSAKPGLILHNPTAIEQQNDLTSLPVRVPYLQSQGYLGHTSRCTALRILPALVGSARSMGRGNPSACPRLGIW